MSTLTMVMLNFAAPSRICLRRYQKEVDNIGDDVTRTEFNPFCRQLQAPIVLVSLYFHSTYYFVLYIVQSSLMYLIAQKIVYTLQTGGKVLFWFTTE